MQSRILKKAERLSDDLAAAQQEAAKVAEDEATWLRQTLEPMLRPLETLQARTKDLPEVSSDLRDLADLVQQQKALLEEIFDRVQAAEAAGLKDKERLSVSIAELFGEARVVRDGVSEVTSIQKRVESATQRSLDDVVGAVRQLGPQIDTLSAQMKALAMAVRAQTARLEQVEGQLVRREDAERRRLVEIQSGSRRQRVEQYLLTALMLAALGLIALWLRR